MTFREAQSRLLADLRHRIHNGDLTERGLARLTGISQPHVHNVLKGVRFLSQGSLDVILKCLNYSLLDLFTEHELDSYLARSCPAQRAFELKVLESVIGPSAPWRDGLAAGRRFTLPAGLEKSAADLVLAGLKFDERMAAGLARFDLAVLDTSERFRCHLSPEGLYVISRQGEAILRQVRPGANCLYLVTFENFDDPMEWEALALPAGGVLELVKARVVWIGQEEELNVPHQSGRFLAEATS